MDTSIRAYDLHIDVVENGYIATLEGPYKAGGETPSRTVTFATAYTLGQWLDNNLPKPAGRSGLVVPSPEEQSTLFGDGGERS